MRNSKLFLGLSVVCTVLAFQNCGPAFQAKKYEELPTQSRGLLSSGHPLSCEAALRGSSENHIRKLSKSELTASLVSLFGSDVMSNSAVSAALAAIPEDKASVKDFDNSLNDVLRLETLAIKITDVVFANATILNRTLVACSTASVDTCRTNLVNRFAVKAYRRILSDDLKNPLLTLMNSRGGIDGVKEGMIRVLISPYFHQHIEIGDGAEIAKGAVKFKLSLHEVASRLAFRLTGAPPDETLLAKATDGSLAKIEELRAQGERLLKTAEARSQFRKINSSWLGISSLRDPTSVAANDAGISSAGWASESLEELQRYSVYEVFDKNANFKTLMTDPVAFTYTDRLAKAYQVTRSDAPVAIAPARGGLLLKPFLFISDNNLSRPILRGKFIQESMFCNEIEDPDQAMIAARLASAGLNHADYAEREYTTRLTAPSNCMNCHSSMDPYGYALEGMGPTGLPRSTDRYLNDQGAAKDRELNTVVYDAPLPNGDKVDLNGAQDLRDLVAKSIEARQCFMKKVIEATQYREMAASDSCLINDLTQSQIDGAPVLSALLGAVANEDIYWKSARELM